MLTVKSPYQRSAYSEIEMISSILKLQATRTFRSICSITLRRCILFACFEEHSLYLTARIKCSLHALHSHLPLYCITNRVKCLTKSFNRNQLHCTELYSTITVHIVFLRCDVRPKVVYFAQSLPSIMHHLVPSSVLKLPKVPLLINVANCTI